MVDDEKSDEKSDEKRVGTTHSMDKLIQSLQKVQLDTHNYNTTNVCDLTLEMTVTQLKQHCDKEGIDIDLSRRDSFNAGIQDAMHQISKAEMSKNDIFDEIDIVTERHNPRLFVNSVIHRWSNDYIGCYVHSSNAKQLHLVNISPLHSQNDTNTVCSSPNSICGCLFEHSATSDKPDNQRCKDDRMRFDTENYRETRSLFKYSYPNVTVLIAAETDCFDSTTNEFPEIKYSNYKESTDKHCAVLNMKSHKVLKIWSQTHFGGNAPCIIAYHGQDPNFPHKINDIQKVNIEDYVQSILDQQEEKDKSHDDTPTRINKDIQKTKYVIPRIFSWLKEKMQFLATDTLYYIECNGRRKCIEIKSFKECETKFSTLIKENSSNKGLVSDENGTIDVCCV